MKINELKNYYPNMGTVEWISVRPNRGEAVIVKNKIFAIQNYGLADDRSSSSAGGKRQATLFQAEYLAVLKSLHPQSEISYQALRRNIAVSGINLNALSNRRIKIGQAIFEITGFCHPCSKMEMQLGVGAYNALRGHGGLTARIIESGEIALGDKVQVLIDD